MFFQVVLFVERQAFEPFFEALLHGLTLFRRHILKFIIAACRFFCAFGFDRSLFFR